MIRGHYPALLRSMCKNAHVHTIGNDTAWSGSYTGAHALLRGTAGTGKSAFMFVMFIEFLKMLRAPPDEDVVESDGVVVFNPAVTSIIIQWDGVYGGYPIILGESVDFRRRVHLFDAGQDPPVHKLPHPQGQGYFLATASANPTHYKAWDSKQPQMKRPYSVLWSMEELRKLITLQGDTVNISEEQLRKRYDVVGGVPRLILEADAAHLMTAVRALVGSITVDMVRTVRRNDREKGEALLHTGTGTQSFSLFAMDVKAEGDFDDVRVRHLAPVVNGGSAIRFSALTSTHLQMKFLTPLVESMVCEQVDTVSLAKTETEASDSVKLGRGHSRSVTFEKLAFSKLASNGYNGQIRVLAHGNTRAECVAEMHLPPCGIRLFMDAKHLHQQVATDLEHGEIRIYIPIPPSISLVDAWCVCTIDEKRTVVGLQVPVAKLKHSAAGEDVAKAQFNAIHGALATCRVPVHKAAWVVCVLPSANYSKVPKVGTGEQRRKAGRIWPHTLARVATPLGEQGKPPATAAAMRDMRAKATAVELSAAVTPDDLRMLYHMGPTRAAQLLSVLHDNTRDVSVTVEGFLDSLESSHTTLARVLKHERNRGRWAYHAQVWAGSAPAPAAAQRAVRPKRRAEADGTACGYLLRRGHTKRARRGMLKAERAWQTNNAL